MNSGLWCGCGKAAGFAGSDHFGWVSRAVCCGRVAEVFLQARREPLHAEQTARRVTRNSVSFTCFQPRPTPPPRVPSRPKKDALGQHHPSCERLYEPVEATHTPRMASWRSGDAADCKSVYTGSIPVLASNKINDLASFLPSSSPYTPDTHFCWRVAVRLRG